jgi:hypoxanthine phosphoribosyltransferase
MITEIQGRKLRLLISDSDIKRRVGEIGKQITKEYSQLNPLMIGILKGGFIFLADLVRQIDFNVEIDFIRASSYKEGMESGDIELVTDVITPLKGRHVILVEDMLDTGITLDFLKSTILLRRPASLKICALIDKKERRQVDIRADYVGFVVNEGFIVGYGTDCGEMGRNLPAVYVLE